MEANTNIGKTRNNVILINKLLKKSHRNCYVMADEPESSLVVFTPCILFSNRKSRKLGITIGFGMVIADPSLRRNNKDRLIVYLVELFSDCIANFQFFVGFVLP